MRKAFKGFTIVELVVVIAVIGILSTIGVVSFVNIQKKSRDDQRLSQVTLIGEAIEKYYDTNGKYPDCATLKTKYDEILSSLDKDVLVSPTATDKSQISIRCSTDTDLPENGSDVFYYNTTKDAGGVITKWNLEHFSEIKKQKSTKIIANRRGDTTVEIAPKGSYKLTVKTSGRGIVDKNNGVYATGSKVNLKATADTGWVFDGWSNCSSSTDKSVRVTMDENKTCKAKFIPNTPKMNEVTTSTPDASTTWSWDDVACPDSTTASYRYNYTTSAGYEEPFDALRIFEGVTRYILPTATSYKRLTMWTDNTYTLNVQARCSIKIDEEPYNSGWSASKSANYYRPISNYTLTTTVSPSGAGTANGSGSYVAGTSASLSTSANTGYEFKNWTGDNGCSGASSHTISMTSNKSCIANFTLATPTMTGVTVSSADINNAIWTWPAVTSCPVNTKADYHFRYTSTNIMTNAQGYDSKWQPESSPNPKDSVAEGISSGYVFDANNLRYTRFTGYTNYRYKIEVGVRCISTTDPGNIFSGWSNPKSASYDRLITAEAPTSVSVSTATSGGKTTWTPSASCPTSGSTIKYEYYYSTDAPYDEGWSSSTNVTSYNYTISGTKYTRDTYWQGYKYTVKVRANCTLNGVTSGWTEGSADYVRPFSAPSIDIFNYSWLAPPKTRWDWSASVCDGKGPTTTTYNYEFYKESNNKGGYTKNSTASSTTTDSYRIFDITGDPGYGYKVRVRAKCSNSNTGSDSSWGGWSDYIEYIRGIPVPTATFSGVEECAWYEGSCVKMYAYTNCATGTSVYYVADVYTSMYYWDTSYTKGGWFGNANDSTTWFKSAFAKDTTGNIKIAFQLYDAANNIVTFPKDSYLGIRIIGYCQNNTTGRRSVKSGTLSSGGKIVP